MAKRRRWFANAGYGPLGLRPVLRARLQPGERIVGWGEISLTSTGSSSALVAAAGTLGLVPVLLPLSLTLFQLIARATHRVAVLTDRRLILLHMMPGPRGAASPRVALEVPLTGVHLLRRGGGGEERGQDRSRRPVSFLLVGPALDRVLLIRFHRLPTCAQGGGRARLRAGLDTISVSADAASLLA